MKKSTKTIISLCLILIIICATTTTFFAELVLNYSGYLYTYINNELVSIYGVEEGMTEASFPAVINSRKVVDIRNNAFYDNSGLESVDFSNATNLERIGSFAFAGCSKLSGNIVIPQAVEIIETAAFQECTSLSHITFDSIATRVPNQCCYGCSDLESVVFNDNIITIDGYAFANCPKLNYVEIPSSVKNIDETAFDSTISLGVYRNSFGLEFAEKKGISYVILDPEPTEPPTEPEPTEVPTDAPTEPEPTEAPTETLTEAPTEIPTESAQTVSFLLGDVNDDGEVNIIDSTIIQRVLAKIIVDTDGMISLRGDIDDNGLSIDDVTLLGRYHAHIHLDYPINTIVNKKIK